MGRKRIKDRHPTIVGLNCRRLHDERGWTQADLAAAAKISPATIAKLELGANQSPDLSTIRAIASAFVVPFSVLIAEEGVQSTVGPFLEAFYRSHWAAALVPTRDEKEWLESLPDSVWVGLSPSAETIAHLLLWHRRARPR